MWIERRQIGVMLTVSRMRIILYRRFPSATEFSSVFRVINEKVGRRRKRDEEMTDVGEGSDPGWKGQAFVVRVRIN